MKNWENHERKCTEFLNNNYGKYATFTHCGGSNSNVNDIMVKAPTRSFSIDVKLCPAQCGQFVLIPNRTEKRFEYGKNRLKRSKYTDIILEYMNDHFDEFCDAGTKGKEISLPSDILFGLIKETYLEKGVLFFMPNESIIPTWQINQYFDVSAVYRVKKSGSGSVNKKEKEIIKGMYSDLYEEGKKPFSSRYHNDFEMDGRTYIFADRDDRYEVRRLSNTKNANVIFTIRNPRPCTDEEFIKMLI